MLPGMLSESNTIRNFPKLPVGSSIAAMRPPTLPSAYPALQDGTVCAATTAAAPKHCRVI